MNFEAKLNRELPWSQKFCENKVEMLGISRKYYYGPNDALRGMITRWVFDKEEKNVCVIVEYMESDGQALQACRIGGPSSYEYKDGKIIHPTYSIRDVTFPPAPYWRLMTARFSKVYRRTLKRGMVYYFRTKINVPCPYSYSEKHQRFVWKLFGKRVSFSTYWKYWEQRFTDLRHELPPNLVYQNWELAFSESLLIDKDLFEENHV